LINVLFMHSSKSLLPTFKAKAGKSLEHGGVVKRAQAVVRWGRCEANP